MPSPVLHSAAGLAIYCIDRTALASRRLRFAGLILLAALIPDADFVFGMLLADPNRFHAGFTHSLGTAVLAGVAFGLVAGGRRLRVGLLCFLACASHVILDSLTLDGRPPLGVPLFWPVSERYFNFPLIGGIVHGMGGVSIGEFLRHIFSVENVRTLVIEIALGSVLILGSVFVGGVRSRRSSPRS